MMITLQKVLDTDKKDLLDLIYEYQITEKQAKQLHKMYFNVYQHDGLGMLGLCSPEDYALAFLKAIKRDIKYDEKKYLRSKGWSEEEIKTTIWG